MKRYLLLRNNRESGPYSTEELAARGLRPLDLIWIEGESTSWAYPEEIPSLRSAVRSVPAPADHTHIYVSLPGSPRRSAREYAPAAYAAPAPALASVEPIRERLLEDDPKPVWQQKKEPFRSAGVLNLFLVFIGLAACALVMKKLVDSTGETAATQTPATAVPWPGEEARAEKTVPTPPAPLPMASAAVEKMPLKTVRVTDLRRKMSVSTNQYDVGLFGGINNLKLTVSNGSPYKVDRTVLSVNYLKPSGEVVESATYDVPSLRPGATQTISVPRTGRGVRVTYRILRIYSQEYKTALKGLAQTS